MSRYDEDQFKERADRWATYCALTVGYCFAALCLCAAAWLLCSIALSVSHYN